MLGDDWDILSKYRELRDSGVHECRAGLFVWVCCDAKQFVPNFGMPSYSRHLLYDGKYLLACCVLWHCSWSCLHAGIYKYSERVSDCFVSSIRKPVLCIWWNVLHTNILFKCGCWLYIFYFSGLHFEHLCDRVLWRDSRNLLHDTGVVCDCVVHGPWSRTVLHCWVFQHGGRMC